MGKPEFERVKPHINLAPWMLVVAFLVVAGGIVAAAILYPGKDRTAQVGAETTPKASASATQKPQHSDEPSASPAVAGQRSGAVSPETGGASVGGSSTNTISGEFAESSEGQDQVEAEREADAAEAELERESDEQRADAEADEERNQD